MLGLADSNDPTPPIRFGRPGMVRSLLAPFIGLAWIVFGAIRVGSSFWDGLLYLVGGVIFVGIGVVRVIAWRRSEVRRSAPAPGTDGGTGSRP